MQGPIFCVLSLSSKWHWVPGMSETAQELAANQDAGTPTPGKVADPTLCGTPWMDASLTGALGLLPCGGAGEMN